LIKDRIIDIYNRINIFSKKMKYNQLDIYAGAASFFLFVSFIPFLMLLLSIIAYTPITDEDLYLALCSIIPARSDEFAHYIINVLSHSSIAGISVSAVGAIWLAAWGLQSLKKGLNKIYAVDNMKNFVIIRLNAVLYTVIFIVSIVVIFIINLFTNRLFTIISSRFSDFGINLSESWFGSVFSLRFLIVIILTFLFCLFFFWVLPDTKITLKYQIPGAAFVALVWYIFSKLFSLYVDKFNAYSMYGSLSFLIIILMWL